MARQPRPYSPLEQRGAKVVMKVMTCVNNFVFRRTGGRIGGRFGGAPVCLVTTVGRRSGKSRTVPLLYMRDGDDVVIVASKGGMPQHPAWYLILIDDPHVSIRVGDDERLYEARTASQEERARLWPQLVSMYRSYASYQQKTDREIPVVICAPAG